MYEWLYIFREVIQQNLRLFCLALHKSKRENIFLSPFVLKTCIDGLKTHISAHPGFQCMRLCFNNKKSILIHFCKATRTKIY